MNTNSEQLMKRAVNVMPGGVNSPVRAYNAVGGSPVFIKRADGAIVSDEDGNRYIDYVGSWGPMIFGHNDPDIANAVITAARDGLSFGACTKREVEFAELICENIPAAEKLRMVNSGTEAVMSAVRAARGYTGRDKIIKFDGNYHGHSDAMLAAAGSGVLTCGISASAGVSRGAVRDTLIAEYNDTASVRELFDANPGEIAAVIVEPVAANMGVVPPNGDFLRELSELCAKNGSVLIFDEVITGFRLAFGGGAEYFGIRPDLCVYGKIIGGGMPAGAYAGRKEIMDCVAPAGNVYQAGTLSGNPVALAAGLAALKKLLHQKNLYKMLEERSRVLADGLCAVLGCTVNQVGSLIGVFFTDAPVRTYSDAVKSDQERYAAYFRHMLARGIMLAPSAFEAMFVSAAHTEDEIAETLDAARDFKG